MMGNNYKISVEYYAEGTQCFRATVNCVVYAEDPVKAFSMAMAAIPGAVRVTRISVVEMMSSTKPTRYI